MRSLRRPSGSAVGRCGFAVLAGTARLPRPVPGRRAGLHPDRAAARARQAVLVEHGLRADTRSQIQAGQDNAALRLLCELNDIDTDSPIRLNFGPEPPGGAAAGTRSIKTIPGKGWLDYFASTDPGNPSSAAPGNYPPSSQVERARYVTELEHLAAVHGSSAPR